ncbi:hypothetical protein Tco_1209662 [Tanacetum coccineum]
MSSRVSNRTVNIAEPPRTQKSFLKSKDLACPTCKKCIYSANHDECILKYLSKVNSRASAQKKDAQSHKTTKRYIPVEKKSDSKNHGRQIPIGQRFSPNKSSNVYLKTTPPRSGLTWKPTGRIFTQVGLKWIPIRKSVETRYNTNDSASPLGKETHNPKTVICANSSSLSACTSMASEPISSKEHPSDTEVFTVKMEILLEPTSNKLLVIRWWRYLIPAEVRFITTCSCCGSTHFSKSRIHYHMLSSNSKTYYKHQDQEIKKLKNYRQRLPQNSDIKINFFPSRKRNFGGRYRSFPEDARVNEHVGQDTNRQGWKKRSILKDKDIKNLEHKDEVKDKDKAQDTRAAAQIMKEQATTR